MPNTIYKEIRKAHELTRDDVCDKALLMNVSIQPERLERIENGKFPITPDEVMQLTEIYGEPTRFNNTACNRGPRVHLAVNLHRRIYHALIRCINRRCGGAAESFHIKLQNQKTSQILCASTKQKPQGNIYRQCEYFQAFPEQ